MLLLVALVILVLQIPFRGTAALPKRRLSMSSKSFAANQLSVTAHASVQIPDNGSDKKLIHTNNMKLEAFAMRIAWVFASIVVLLVVVSFLLAVAGYAGSRLALH